MSNSSETNEQSEQGKRARPVQYGELGVAVLVAGIGTFFLVQTARMDASSSAAFLGPRFFPTVIGVVMIMLGVLLAIQTLRSAQREESEESEVSPAEQSTDWKSLGIVAATLVLHLLLLDLLGWIIAGSLLFWGASYGLGGRHVLRDLAISIVVACAVQVLFSAILGLSLPSGILVGV